MTQNKFVTIADTLKQVPFNFNIEHNRTYYDKDTIVERLNFILKSIDGRDYYETDESIDFWLFSWLDIDKVSDRTNFSCYYKTFKVRTE